MKVNNSNCVICQQCGESIPVNFCKEDITKGWLCAKCIEARHYHHEETFEFADGTKIDKDTENIWDLVVR